MEKIIKNPAKVLTLAKEKKCVEIKYPKGWKRVTASFAENFPFKYLLEMVLQNRVRIYASKKTGK